MNIKNDNTINIQNFNEKFKQRIENSTINNDNKLSFIKMENNGRVCINRDYNGCLNMKKIFNSFMTDGTRPQRYSRGYDLIKNTNTSLEGSSGIRLAGD